MSFDQAVYCQCYIFENDIVIVRDLPKFKIKKNYIYSEMCFFLSIFIRNFWEFCMAVCLSVLVIFTEFLLAMIPFGHVIFPDLCAFFL